MSIRELLDQLLQPGQALARGHAAGGDGGGLGDLLKNGLGQLTGQGGGQPAISRGNAIGGGLGSMMFGFGGGALSGGVLGNKKLRKSGGKIALYDGHGCIGRDGLQGVWKLAEAAGGRRRHSPDWRNPGA